MSDGDAALAVNPPSVALPGPVEVLGRSPGHQRATERATEYGSHGAIGRAERAPTKDVALATPYVIPDAFSVAQCDHLRRMFDSSPDRVPAQVTSGLASQRRATVATVDRHRSEIDWLTTRIAWLSSWANTHLYEFAVTGLDEDFQLLRYETGDFFTWHLDCGSGAESTRKLSMSIQLSAPEDYDGGRLEFAVDPRPPMAGLQGAAIIFPSYLAHRITPLTRGTRDCLVAWAHGPAFR